MTPPPQQPKAAKPRRPKRMWRDLDGSLHETKAPEGHCVPVLVLDASEAGLAALRANVRDALQAQYEKKTGHVAPGEGLDCYTYAVLAALGLAKGRNRK